VGHGQAATDTGGTGLFAVPDGLKNFVAMFQLIGAAKSIHQFVQNGLLGFARRIDQNAIIYKPFRKTHIVILYL
jgi:hypothetical protein